MKINRIALPGVWVYEKRVKKQSRRTGSREMMDLADRGYSWRMSQLLIWLLRTNAEQELKSSIIGNGLKLNIPCPSDYADSCELAHLTAMENPLETPLVTRVIGIVVRSKPSSSSGESHDI